MSLIALFDVEMPEILEEIKNRNLSTHPLIDHQPFTYISMTHNSYYPHAPCAQDGSPYINLTDPYHIHYKTSTL